MHVAGGFVFGVALPLGQPVACNLTPCGLPAICLCWHFRYNRKNVSALSVNSTKGRARFGSLAAEQ
jgi:hypothetical protein